MSVKSSRSKKEDKTKLELSFKIPNMNTKDMTKCIIKYSSSIALFIFLIFVFINLLSAFTPHFSDKTTVSTSQVVSYTEDKYMLSLTVKNQSEVNNFVGVEDRMNYVKSYLSSYWKRKPKITPSLYVTSKYNNGTYTQIYVKKYSLTGELKMLDLDWDNLISKVDSLSLNFVMSDDLKIKLEEESKKMAINTLSKKADFNGGNKFLVYLGKKLDSESSYCGSNQYNPVYYSSKLESVGLSSSDNVGSDPVQVGDSEGSCTVSRVYTIYGIGFSGNLFG